MIPRKLSRPTSLSHHPYDRLLSGRAPDVIEFVPAPDEAYLVYEPEGPEDRKVWMVEFRRLLRNLRRRVARTRWNP